MSAADYPRFALYTPGNLLHPNANVNRKREPAGDGFDARVGRKGNITGMIA